mgnify:FL=1
MSRRGTRRANINKRRKGKLAVILPWLKRFGILLGGAFFFLWLGAWLWMSGAITRAGDSLENAVIELAAAQGFKVENILVEGRVHADADTLKAIINIERGDPMFAFDPARAKAMIEKMNWVKAARVERRWPDTLYIGLTERVPLALWQRNNALSLIDETGTVITAENLGRFRDLIIVMGDEAPARARDLLSNLQATPQVFPHVASAKWMGERRWDLILKNSVTVKLPEQDYALALKRLEQAQIESGLLDKPLEAIDLRDPARMIVRTKPGQTEEYKAGLKQSAASGNDI